MTKKRIIYATGIIISMIVLGCIWNSFYSPTRIAFINYQVISLGEISKSNDNSFIKISELATDDIDQINRYDMVFINGMGLRITEAQREIIQRQADKGLPVLTTSATNPDNNINTLDSINHAAISKYISNGGRKNYRSLLNYVRLNIDKKKFSTEMPQEATARSNDIIYHSDIQNPDNEDLGFNSIKDYHSFLNKNGMMEGKNSRIIITGQMGEPTDLIKALEKSGNIVYPVRNIRSFMQNGMIDSIQPSAVINMAHGRMGDYMVEIGREAWRERVVREGER